MLLPLPLTLLILFVLTALSDAHGKLGINCKGSSQCSKVFVNTNSKNVIDALDQLINNASSIVLPGGPLNDTMRYFSGDNIACAKNVWSVGSICMFMQGNVPAEGVDGVTIGKRISDLNYHGCDICGSVPLSGDNNPDEMGILTVNYVTSKGCNGICEGVYAGYSES